MESTNRIVQNALDRMACNSGSSFAVNGAISDAVKAMRKSVNSTACNAKFKVGDVVKCKAGWKGRVVRIDGGTVHGYDSKFGPFEAKESDCEVVNSTACNFQAPVFGKPKVGDTVRYAGGFYKVLKDLGAGKYVLRSKTTGGTVAVTALKGLEVMEQDSVANSRVARNATVIFRSYTGNTISYDMRGKEIAVGDKVVFAGWMDTYCGINTNPGKDKYRVIGGGNGWLKVIGVSGVNKGRTFNKVDGNGVILC